MLGGDMGLLWASLDYNVPSCRNLPEYRPVSHLLTSIDAAMQRYGTKPPCYCY